MEDHRVRRRGKPDVLTLPDMRLQCNRRLDAALHRLQLDRQPQVVRSQRELLRIGEAKVSASHV